MSVYTIYEVFKYPNFIELQVSKCFYTFSFFGMTHKYWGDPFKDYNLINGSYRLYNHIEHKLISVHYLITKLPLMYLCIRKRTGLALYWNIIFLVCIQSYNVSSHQMHYFIIIVTVIENGYLSMLPHHFFWCWSWHAPPFFFLFFFIKKLLQVLIVPINAKS